MSDLRMEIDMEFNKNLGELKKRRVGGRTNLRESKRSGASAQKVFFHQK